MFHRFSRAATLGASCLALAATATAAQAATTIVMVEGDNNPFLAGQPDGATALGDSAPNQSPTLALTNFDTSQAITFSALGGFNFSGGAPAPSADGNGGFANMNSGQLGISGAMGIRYNALVGVFLDDSVPMSPAPAQRSDGVDFASISPGLNQIFWIGDGLTGTGTGSVQTFFAPTGATRLFLGSTDGVGWFNNSGVSTVTINYTALPTTGAVPEPATWAMLILGFGAIGGAMRSARRRATGAMAGPGVLPAMA